jgi:hypothetical protein
MTHATQGLITLLGTIEKRIEQNTTIPLQTICLVAGDITQWSHSVDLSELNTKACGVFGQIMNVVKEGMAGTTQDAQRALTTIKASLNIFNRALSKSLKAEQAA